MGCLLCSSVLVQTFRKGMTASADEDPWLCTPKGRRTQQQHPKNGTGEHQQCAALRCCTPRNSMSGKVLLSGWKKPLNGHKPDAHQAHRCQALRSPDQTPKPALQPGSMHRLDWQPTAPCCPAYIPPACRCGGIDRTWQPGQPGGV